MNKNLLSLALIGALFVQYPATASPTKNSTHMTEDDAARLLLHKIQLSLIDSVHATEGLTLEEQNQNIAFIQSMSVETLNHAFDMVRNFVTQWEVFINAPEQAAISPDELTRAVNELFYSLLEEKFGTDMQKNLDAERVAVLTSYLLEAMSMEQES